MKYRPTTPVLALSSLCLLALSAPTLAGSALAGSALAGSALAAPAPQGLHVGPPTVQPQPDPRVPERIPGRNPTRRPGRIVRPGPSGIEIKSLSIKANIVDGVATTSLSQVFHNRGSRQAEGTWILPLPEGATADHFTMTMNGKQVAGEILSAQNARQVYTSIVRRQRDPGLLEYMGNGCLRARVFPIPAKSDMVVEVRYRQILPATAGVHNWSFPLRAAHVGGRPAAKLNLDVTIESKKAIKNVYSPSPGVDISRKGDRHARVSLELGGDKIAARDLDVFYGLSDKEFGLNLLTHRKQGKDGYFVLMLSPKMSWDESKALPKCVNFVVDTSGSMNGKKIEQARNALRFFVNSLKGIDHFNVIPFSTEARPFFSSPVSASKENIEKALAQAKDLEARGGTNIEQALATALSAPMPEIANLVGITVFLTDGMPTIDTTNTDKLLKITEKNNTNKHRIFVFGVGHDVNTRLLDKIAQDSHGDRDYVREHESIEVKTGALFTKLSHPVMTDVKIDCEGIEGFDVYPRTTPDLFKGSRLMLTGRYKGDGHHSIRLKGTVEGKAKEFIYEGSFPKTAKTNDFIPTLWAQRKVAVLLDAIRLNGSNAELVQEVKRLGTEHGIVTPYTSNLILEESDRVSWRNTPRRRNRGRRGGEAGGAASGGGRGGGGFGRQGRPATANAPPPSAELKRIADELRRAGVVGGKNAEKEVARAAKPRTKAGAGAADHAGAGQRGGRGASRRRGSAPGSANRPAGSTQPTAGAKKKAEVNYSLALRTLARSKSIETGEGRANLVTRNIQGHTFHLIGGVWIDGKFEKGMEAKVKKVKAFSDDYFALLTKHPEMAKILAFSTRIVVVLGEKENTEIIEIVAADEK